MKKLFLPALAGFSLMMLLTGCVGLQFGGGSKSEKPTVGQQLIDLQKARSSGAITDAEYQVQKARLLEH